jgi:ERCC4-type nuclease
MTKLHILIDTREQNPLTWSTYQGISTALETLPCGDYTITGHDLPSDDNSIIVERKKDCKEFARNIGADWDRFKNELELMREYKNKMIIICTPNNFDELYQIGFTKLHPNFVAKQLAVIQTHYQIPVLFMNNRSDVENLMFRMFYEILKKTEEEA